MSERVIIVGAGVGGLAAAIRLRAAGREVTVLERGARPGGKMREVNVGGLAFDAGPSVLTMPQVFDDLFAAAGEKRAEWVRFVPLEPACRHVFADGTVLDLFNDEPAARDGRSGEPWERSAAAVARVIGGESAEQYRRFRRHAAEVYRTVERPFLLRALPRSPLLLPFTHDWRDALGMSRLDSRRSLWRSLEGFFSDERLRVLFARYATYCGSDPFRAPATLSVIPHVELSQGLHAVQGGMYRLTEALVALGQKLGVRLQCGVEAERIELYGRERRVVAVKAGGERIPADVVVVNCDVRSLARRLLLGTRTGARLAQRVEKDPASLSAFVHLVRTRKGATEAGPLLRHHNVFFSADYRREFADLTQAGCPPEDPTVYLCAPPGQDRWFFLTNTPPLPAGPQEEKAAQAYWQEQAHTCRDRIATRLAGHGIDLSQHAAAEASVTPVDFAALFPDSRGSLYGAASDTPLSAFRRPENRVRGVRNLYCVGGSTHPGAGVPMVALSARIVADLILKG